MLSSASKASSKFLRLDDFFALPVSNSLWSGWSIESDDADEEV